MAVSELQVQTALKELVDPNTHNDYVSTKSDEHQNRRRADRSISQGTAQIPGRHQAQSRQLKANGDTPPRK